MIPRCAAQTAVALALAAAAIALAACASDPTKGYVWGSSYAADIRTVHVPIFQNNTFARGLESELTDAIIKEIQATTPWKVVSGDAAGATLSGAIGASGLRPLSFGRDTGLVQEEGYQIAVNFEFKDNRTGKVLVARKNFAAGGVFIPAQGLNERIETGQHEAIAKLARDLVAELRSTW